MNHDFYSPVWTQYRGRFVENVAAFVRASLQGLDHAFARLSAHQFDAPWRRTARQQMRNTRFSSYR
ncbi:hypothetical protein DFR49_1838 [Hephaestia caeni]|uniref:Uncharacterized protein n=1 Tax=Hephaestia caeni TaxID=645617 RepID=A0A397PBY5_9SPHN|nr:hypothetical protein [Hephaestia caeni]RIA43614.1 hypothetical protein DFR49_1838 [Hephaestia caeni]